MAIVIEMEELVAELDTPDADTDAVTLNDEHGISAQRWTNAETPTITIRRLVGRRIG